MSMELPNPATTTANQPVWSVAVLVGIVQSLLGTLLVFGVIDWTAEQIGAVLTLSTVVLTPLLAWFVTRRTVSTAKLDQLVADNAAEAAKPTTPGG